MANVGRQICVAYMASLHGCVWPGLVGSVKHSAGIRWRDLDLVGMPHGANEAGRGGEWIPSTLLFVPKTGVVQLVTPPMHHSTRRRHCFDWPSKQKKSRVHVQHRPCEHDACPTEHKATPHRCHATPKQQTLLVSSTMQIAKWLTVVL
jgi:hypothetical protein